MKQVEVHRKEMKAMDQVLYWRKNVKTMTWQEEIDNAHRATPFSRKKELNKSRLYEILICGYCNHWSRDTGHEPQSIIMVTHTKKKNLLENKRDFFREIE